MDYQTVTQLVASVGFPIIACGAMAMYVKDITNKFMAQLSDTEKTHEKEIDSLQECLNNNTVVLEKILEHMRETKEE